MGGETEGGACAGGRGRCVFGAEVLYSVYEGYMAFTLHLSGSKTLSFCLSVRVQCADSLHPSQQLWSLRWVFSNSSAEPPLTSSISKGLKGVFVVVYGAV